MLPDYCETKDQLQKVFDRLLHSLIRQRLGPLAEVPGYRVFEGTNPSIIRPDGTEDVTVLKPYGSEFEIKFEEVPHLTISDIYRRLDAMAQEMADAMAKTFYATMSEAAEQVGNVVKSSGRITPEAILEVLDKIELGFDEKGNPALTSVHIHPDMAETLKESILSLQNDPNLRLRYEEIIQRKREQWRVREAGRKLVG